MMIWPERVQLSDEFSILGIPLGTGRLIIANPILNFVSSKKTTSDKGRTVRKIWLRMGRRRMATLLILLRSRLNAVIAVNTGHCVIKKYARRIGLGHLAYDFCRNSEKMERGR